MSPSYSCFRQCRRGLTRECDLLSQHWALTRSKAKHFPSTSKHSFPHPQAQAGSQSTPQPPPCFKSPRSTLSSHSPASRNNLSRNFSYQPTHPLGRGAGPIQTFQTSVIIIFYSQPLTALLRFILHTIHPSVVGNCTYGAHLLRRHA